MGEKKRRRELFFAKNPRCCFCSGVAKASTEDHQPSRVFFKDRCWPEGFVFPACEECNAVSAPSEKLLSLLIHGEAESADRDEYQKLLTSVRSEYPDLISHLIPNSTREIRNLFKAKGLKKPTGVAYSEVPIVKLDRVFWDPHFEMVARKLLLALHYQCFGKPLSLEGRIWWFVHTNADYFAGDFPEEIVNLASNVAHPIRQKRLLSDQFLVRWNFISEPRTGVFVMLFHGNLSISGVTTEAPEPFGLAFPQEPVRSFSW